ncbi:MAG TPA: PHP domain-containing protein, partial [Nitrosopumilaceae archaeon]|nr:PHP domain-containing protein [Nitrosopumilaceae archaeon]
MRASPHTHSESPLTGSTLAALVGRAKEMGRDYFAYTDHGHLSSALKAYALCKPDKKERVPEYLKRKIQFIPGIEIYFKDFQCPVIAGTDADRCKYFTTTIYCEDQEAYQELAKMISTTTFPTITVYEETQQLWSWKELEHISKFKTNIILSGPHCMVAKPMLAGRPDLGKEILRKLQELFPNRIRVALITEPWSKKWTNVIEVQYTDGTRDSLLSNDQVSTDKARRIKAMDLINKGHHTFI